MIAFCWKASDHTRRMACASAKNSELPWFNSLYKTSASCHYPEDPVPAVMHFVVMQRRLSEQLSKRDQLRKAFLFGRPDPSPAYAFRFGFFGSRATAYLAWQRLQLRPELSVPADEQFSISFNTALLVSLILRPPRRLI